MSAAPAGVWGSDDLARRAETMLTSDDGRGVTLVGPAGIGKTRLARELATRLEREMVVVWVTGSTATRDVPLGAFAPFLPASTDALGLPSILNLRTKLADLADGRELLLAIDDAHDLDEASAALVLQFAVGGDARLLVTQRSGVAAPESITRSGATSCWPASTCSR